MIAVTQNDFNLTGNPVRVHVQEGVVPPGSTGYKYLLKIESADGKLTGAPFISAIAPDEYMEAVFDIQGYIDQPVARTFQWPVSGVAILRDAPVMEIGLRAGERYIAQNGQLVETMNAGITPIIAFKGGVSQRQLDIWAGAGLSFQTEYLQNHLFLTQRPQDDIVHQRQPVKLWYYDTEGGVANKLKFTCFYSNDTTVVTDVAVTMAAAGLYELNVNPYHQGIPLTANSASLQTWSVSLCLDSIQVTDARFFAYDPRHIERPFWLLFANSLGGIDDVYLSGYGKEGFRSEGTPVYKPATTSNTIFDRTLVVPNKSGRNVWQINTGPKTATQMLHLRDLLVSREAWLLYPTNYITSHHVIPVNIESSEVELVDRKEDWYSMGIRMEEAHNSRFNFDNRRF